MLYQEWDSLSRIVFFVNVRRALSAYASRLLEVP